jgi:hypothetical protein
VVTEQLREQIIMALQRVPLPPEAKTLQDAYELGIRRAIEARIRIDGKDAGENLAGRHI